MKGFKEAFDVQHPWFKPLWLRVAIVVFTFCWTGFELWNGNTLWAVFFGACGVYLAYQWLWAWTLEDE